MDTLYIITALWRHQHLSMISESILTLHPYFQTIWLPVSYCESGGIRGAIEKLNLGLDIIRQLSPGWVYHLDDDNIIHPTFGKSLKTAIKKNPDTKVFFFPTVLSTGVAALEKPTLECGNIDTGAFVTHTSISNAKWKWEKLNKCPDYVWIKEVCENNNVKPVCIDDGYAYYNAIGYTNHNRKTSIPML